MPDKWEDEQENVEPVANRDRPYDFDRVPGTSAAPSLRPDQRLLWVPHLEEGFVIPRWTTDTTPAGWALATVDIDIPSLTRTKATFRFRRDAAATRPNLRRDLLEAIGIVPEQEVP